MNLDEGLLKIIMHEQKLQKISFTLEIQKKSYVLQNLALVKSDTPLRRPATRGGVYHSDTYFFKINGEVDDTSIIPLLSNAMLGPNTEFEDLKIKTQLKINDSIKNITIFANLINSVQRSSKIQLNMMVIGSSVE